MIPNATPESPQRHPATYVAYTGWLIAVVIAITWIQRIRLGVYGWMFTWQLVLVAAATLSFALLALVHPSRPPWLRRYVDGQFTLPALFGGLAYIATAFSLAWLDHRRFIFVIGALQGAAVVALLGKSATRATRFWIFFVSLASWALASGLTYVHLGDWLLNVSPTNAWSVAAFVFAFAIVLLELCAHDRERSMGPPTFWFLGIACVVFAAYAFRTDNLASNWVPLHRSYFADVSQFVRDGHWLLWDVPSLYGFLSILALAIVPASDGWQALYELTGVFLTIEALIAAVILRWGRTGWRNALVSIFFPLATILGDNLSRYAWGGRLYPQGGLRFLWVDTLLLVVFLSYAWREKPMRVRALRWAGHLTWLIAVLWSVENALWATATWFAFLFFDVVMYPELTSRPAVIVRRIFLRAWPAIVLPFAAYEAIDWWYRSRLGSHPDWRAYVEFTGLFASGKVRAIFHVQDFGAAWCIVLVLAAVGTVGLLALRERQWALTPLLATTWCATWVTASYFALEPLDMYVTLLLAVLVPAAAIAIFASRQLHSNDPSAWLARLSVAPLMIVSIAVALGEPSRLAAMKLPLTRSWSPNVIGEMPPIDGELKALMARAGVKPGDRVLIPNGPYWTELSQGLILPLTRLPDGATTQYKAWLPVSPIGPTLLANGLPIGRLHTYVNRFIDRSHEAGWYVTYREPARCERLSSRLHTTRTLRSVNFSISSCELLH